MYVDAILSRAGLANRLFRWARAEVFAAETGYPMLAPAWTKAKLGPFIRREPDKRLYIGLFNSHGYPSRSKSRLLRMMRPKLTESEYEAVRERGETPRGSIVQIIGMEDFFEPIRHHSELVHRRLLEITSPRVHRAVADTSGTIAPLCMHIRRGDMPRLTADETPTPDRLAQIPLEFYLRIAHDLKERFGYDGKITVFSDGTYEELSPLLESAGVNRCSTGSALGDMLAMTHAKVIVTSGNSTFSSWPIYLAGLGSVWIDGFWKSQSPASDSKAVSIPFRDRMTDDQGTRIVELLSASP